MKILFSILDWQRKAAHKIYSGLQFRVKKYLGLIPTAQVLMFTLTNLENLTHVTATELAWLGRYGLPLFAISQLAG
jgi:hypothetical protein